MYFWLLWQYTNTTKSSIIITTGTHREKKGNGDIYE